MSSAFAKTSCSWLNSCALDTSGPSSASRTRRAPMSSYNLSRKATGGGVLVITGTHFLDRMLHFWGYPDDVALADDEQGGAEANCRATFRYTTTDTPCEGVVLYSKTTELPGGLIIETDRGVVQVPE